MQTGGEISLGRSLFAIGIPWLLGVALGCGGTATPLAGTTQAALGVPEPSAPEPRVHRFAPLRAFEPGEGIRTILVDDQSLVMASSPDSWTESVPYRSTTQIARSLQLLQRVDGSERWRDVLLRNRVRRELNEQWQTTDSFSGGQRVFEVNVAGDGVSIRDLRGNNPFEDDQRNREAETFERGTSTRERLAARLGAAPVRFDEPLELDAELLVSLAPGATSGAIRLVELAERWGVPTARFLFDGLADGDRREGVVDVDAEDGAILYAYVAGPTAGRIDAEGDQPAVFFRGYHWRVRSYLETRHTRPTPSIRASLAPAPGVSDIEVSPDGRLVAALAHGEVTFFDMNARRVHSSRQGLYDWMHLSDDGGFLLAGNSVGAQGFLTIFSQGVRSFGSIPMDTSLRGYLAQSVDGRRTIGVHADGVVSINDPGYRRRLGAMQLPALATPPVAASSRNGRTAILTERGHALLLRTSTSCAPDVFCDGAEVELAVANERDLPAGEYVDAALSDDGREVYASRRNGTVVHWHVEGRQGGGTVSATAAVGLSLQWSPSGLVTERGYWADGPAFQGDPQVRFPENDDAVRAVLARDAQLLVRGHSQGRLELWDTTGRPLGRIESSTQPVAGVIVAAGRLLAWSERRLFRWRLEDLGVEVLSDDGPIVGVASSSDGRTIALLRPETIEIRVRGQSARSVAGRFDGVWVGSRGDDVPIVVTRSSGGLVVQGTGTALPVPGTVLDAAFHPLRAGALAVVTAAGEVLVLDVRAGTVLSRARVGASAVHGRVAWDASGTQLAVSGVVGGSPRWNPSIPRIETVDFELRSRTTMLPSWDNVTALTFTADGRQLLSGSDTGRLQLHDVATGVQVWGTQDSGKAVTGLALLSDQRIAASGADGSVRVLDPRLGPSPERHFSDSAMAQVFLLDSGVFRDGLTVASLVMVDDQPFVATADGYYTGAPRTLRAIGFQIGNEVFDFEPFDLSRNRPEIVLRRLGRAPARRIELLDAVHARRLRHLGVGAHATSTPPTLEVAAPPLHTDAAFVELEISAGRDETAMSAADDTPAPLRPPSVQLRSLHVTVDSVPVLGAAGLGVVGDTYAGTVRVPLVPGENRVVVWVRNAEGVDSPRRVFVVRSSRVVPARRLFVFAVGVSDYEVDELDLGLAAKDARDIAGAFAQTTAFDQVEVALVLDREATRERVLERGREFLSRARLDDTVVLFFAGHGYLDARIEYFFATTETNLREHRGLAWTELIGLVDATPARNRLLLLDTCHSGEADHDAIRGDGGDITEGARGMSLGARVGLNESFELVRSLFMDLRDSTGAAIISAARGSELSRESSEWNNGAFTKAIVEELLGGDAARDPNQDGIIQVSELERYVSRRVVELTDGAQQPTMRGVNVDLDFAIR